MKVRNAAKVTLEYLQETVVDIITAERQHRVRSTNIQQQVSDICNVAGKWLARQRPES